MSIHPTTTPMTPRRLSRVSIVIARHFTTIVLMLALSSIASAADLTPLAPGGAPPCPEHNGIREFHSSMVEDGDVSAFIVGLAKRDASGCRRTAEIRIEHAGQTKSFALPKADQQDFSIIDFSPDGSKLFLAAEAIRGYPNEQFRYLQVTTVPASSGEMRWQNVWDLLGWKDCDAMVEPQGFTVDGKLAFRVRPSVMSQPRRTNCAPEARLYAIDGHSNAAATQISDPASIKRYGKIVRHPSQSCRSDPDLVGACFIVHGTISVWSGAPTIRISRPGTQRMLGVAERPLPTSVAHVLPSPLAEKLNGDDQASGDFLVCPFTIENPGHMQMACVESASNLTFTRRR